MTLRWGAAGGLGLKGCPYEGVGTGASSGIFNGSKALTTKPQLFAAGVGNFCKNLALSRGSKVCAAHCRNR